MARYDFDLVVIGLGAAGLTAAAAAATAGLRVAAIEQDRAGGECTWTGCVPSKALVASARAAHAVREAHRFGVGGPATVDAADTAGAWRRLRDIRKAIAAEDDDPDDLRALGVEVIVGQGVLWAPHVVRVHDAGGGSTDLSTRFALLCTGGRPVVPEVPGLATTGFFTNETLFDLDATPERALVLGGGPQGVELAQALGRLGSRITLVHRGPRLLPRDEPALVDRLTAVLRGEGVDVRCSTEVVAARRSGAGSVLDLDDGTAVEVDVVVVAAGRRTTIDGLGLERVGVAATADGVVVDGRLRTSAPWVFAAGDATGGPRFTHAAGREAILALVGMAVPAPVFGDREVPWCTFTDPELARTGLTVAQAVERHGEERVRVWWRSFERSDRARTDGTTEGMLALVTARGKLVGAHVLAPCAGELVNELTLAIGKDLSLLELGSVVHVYPSYGNDLVGVASEAGRALLRPVGRALRAWRGDTGPVHLR